MSNRWKEVYRPWKDIKEEWYIEVEEKIKEKEWEEVLRKLNMGTVPGISGISYTLIKWVEIKTQEIFRAFADLCLESEKIPIKWKIVQVYLIPKVIE